MCIRDSDCLGNIQWSKDLGISGSGTNTNFGIAEAQNGDLVYCFNQSPTWFKAVSYTHLTLPTSDLV